MQLNYQLTADDYRQGFNVFRRRSSKARWSLGIVYVAFFACLGVAILQTHADATSGRPVLPYAVAFFCAYYLWYCPYTIGRRMMASNPGARALQTVDVSDEGVHHRSELGESQTDWKAYVGWAENDKVFIVLYSAISFAPVPKRAMTAEQQEELRGLLKQHVIAPKQ